MNLVPLPQTRQSSLCRMIDCPAVLLLNSFQRNSFFLCDSMGTFRRDLPSTASVTF
jgi:hypothetical protein